MKKIYYSPIDLIDESLKKYGLIFKNPLDVLIHVFFVQGNGFDLIEEKGETYIQKDMMREENNKGRKSRKEIELEQKIEKLEYNKNLFEKVKKENKVNIFCKNNNLTKEKFEETIDITNKGLEYFKNIQEKLNPIRNNNVCIVSDLNYEDIAEDSLYLKEIYYSENALFHHIPNNLDSQWKLALNILVKKMKQKSKSKMKTILKKQNKNNNI